MELPGLGESCQATECKQLDFLPMKCDACGKIFCRDHIHYNTHECPESYKKDNQVPVCPLCNSPIAVKKEELPDVIVGRHIDNDCQSDLAKKRRKIYTNRCSFKSCKHKELIPVNCDKCHQNFCLKHRHELDHRCKGFEDTGRGASKAAAAAVNRAGTSNQPKPSSSNVPKSNQGKPQNTMLAYIGKDLARDRRERQSQPTVNNTNSVQGGMTEDEALAHAIQMSMQESQGQPPAPQKPLTREEEEDLLLAQAIAASQQEAQAEQRRRQQAQQNKTSCSLS
ncbi:AN1-type zinc finger protein 2B,AN1-type zinc finger protein 2A [Mytilus coruscus]|uniref:AN1-type zinc finger protein 2B,AN1-type zinc finger protein 2A n=1 Tax=Mytilus coruscus TaxID=42192 RepID=A0A6J8E2B2_MYTCO|nr:AN1-type zinc finger protein 2B,AN1-type zinc finger protein 2A [Mytilus coruscus]